MQLDLWECALNLLSSGDDHMLARRVARVEALDTLPCAQDGTPAVVAALLRQMGAAVEAEVRCRVGPECGPAEASFLSPLENSTVDQVEGVGERCHSRRCREESCSKQAQGGRDYCVAHGGGRRCQHKGCSKAAAGGGTIHCKAHGGGRRCQHKGCSKAAAGGGTMHCVAHGGGRRCQYEGCLSSAHAGGYCVAHSRRCQQQGCAKPAQARSTHCRACAARTQQQQADGAEAL